MKLALILSVVIAPFLVQTASIPEQHEIDKDLVKFFIYTRSNPNRGDQVLWNFDNVDNTNFNPSKKTFVLIHGWTDSIKFAERFVDGKCSANMSNFFVVWSDSAISLKGRISGLPEQR